MRAETRAPASRARVMLVAIFTAAMLISGPGWGKDASRAIRDAFNHQPAARDSDLKHFYELRGFRPAWTPQGAAAAIAAMTRAAHEGLNAANYQVEELPRRVTDKAAATWDMQLTAAFLHYAKDVRQGRLAPGDVYVNVALPRSSFDAANELNAALNEGSLAEFIIGLPPQRAEYAFLRTALAHYRALAASGDDGEIAVRAGQPITAVSAEARNKLQRRLAEEDPNVPALGVALSDQAFRNALRRFQARAGLAQSGALTAETVAALNLSAADRVLQIEANMERWRWLPRQLEDRYIEVNTPDASLKVVENGKTILESPVVVGRRDWATPILATTVQAVVVNPPWRVPADMAGEEILPKLVTNASYLATHNMVLLNGPSADDPHGRTIKWREVPADPFPYQIQQGPGPRGGLGALMLDMPNDFDVYLHDTPDKGLFAQTNRALSHGCVRVRDIAAVASFALFGDTRQADKIPRPPRNETQRVALDHPLPVYMSYWTIFRDSDGLIAFRPDVYGLDAGLTAALQGKTWKTAARSSLPEKRVSAAATPAP